jgi:hypothetical protein
MPDPRPVPDRWPRLAVRAVHWVEIPLLAVTRPPAACATADLVGLLGPARVIHGGP